MTRHGGEADGHPSPAAAFARLVERLPGRAGLSVGVTLVVVLALLSVPAIGGALAGPAGGFASAQADPSGNGGASNGGGSGGEGGASNGASGNGGSTGGGPGGGSGSGASGTSNGGGSNGGNGGSGSDTSGRSNGAGSDAADRGGSGNGGSAADGGSGDRGSRRSGSNGDGAPGSSNRGDGKPPGEPPTDGDRARGPPDDSDRGRSASGNGQGPPDDAGPTVEVSRGPQSEPGGAGEAAPPGDGRERGPPTSVVEVAVSGARAGDDVSVDVAPAPAAAGPVAFDEVSLTVRRDGDFTMRVTNSREPLPGSPAFEPGDGAEALGRVRLDHSIANADVEAVSFVVRVGRERLRAAGTDPEEVVLYRFADGTWTPLPTEVVGEAGRYYLLRVDSPGLSEFAIGAKRPSFEAFWAESSAHTVRPGEPVRISARVTNDGRATGVYRARLLVDGEVVAVRHVTVAAGGTRQVNFHRSFDRPGTYRVAVGDATAGAVVVRERAVPEASSSVGRFSALAFDRFVAEVRALWTPWGA